MTLSSLFRKPASPLSRGLRLLQLVAVLALVGLVSTVAAAPAVTSATCVNSAGYCASAATVVFTGTELTSTIAIGFTAADQAAITCAVTASSTTSVTCTLTTNDHGEYPVYISGTYVGNLLMGTFYEQQGLESNPFNNTGVETQYAVDAQSSTTPENGENFTLYGNFSKDTTYEIYFYNYEKIISASSPGLPLCHSVVMDTDYHNELTCVNLTTTAEKMGAYGILVKDLTTYRYLPGSCQLDSFVIYTPNATVSTVTGDCATNSSKCVTGATLTFTGKDLNVRVPEDDSLWSFYIKLSIGLPNENSDITCAVTAVSGTGDDGTVTCSLTIGSNAVPGAYPIYVLNMIQHHGIYTPEQHIGNLVYGDYYGWYPAGYNSAALPDDTDYRVVALPNTTYTGEKLTIYGYFPTTGDVEVQFYNTEHGSAAYTANLPTCVLPTLTAANVDTDMTAAPNAVTCEMRFDPTQMGAYRVMVINTTTGWYFPGSTTLTPLTITRTPTISSVTGDCATNSSYCVTGATLTFSGKEFNTVTPTAASGYSHYVYFRIGFTQDSDTTQDITCATTGASGASLLTTQTVTCQLTVGANAAYGMYPIYMINQVTYAGLMDNGTHVGNLLYGTFPEWEPAGYSNATLPDDLGYMVTGQNGTIFDHLGSMTILGSFPESKEVAVHFYNLDPEMEASNGGDIGCRTATLVSYGTTSDLADTNGITCVISTNAGKMGTYRFMVEDVESGWIYPGSSYLDGITILHNDAHVKTVTLTCPNSATSCSTGGVLTLTGDHLNVHQPPSASPYTYYINFYIDYKNPSDDEDETTKITCTTTGISGNYGTGSATCELDFTVTAAAGTYPIYAINYASDRGVMHTPAMVGSLVVGTDGTVSTANPWVSNSVTSYEYNVTALAPSNAPAGTSVMLYGNFNTSTTYTVSFTRTDGTTTDSTPTCTVTAITKRTIRCTMVTNSASATASFYPLVYDTDNSVYIRTSLTDKHTLTLSGSSNPGTTTIDKKSFVATLAVLIVFAVLFIGMIVALIVICCCCECRRKTKHPKNFEDQNADVWNHDQEMHDSPNAGAGNKETHVYTQGATLDASAAAAAAQATAAAPQNASAPAANDSANNHDINDQEEEDQEVDDSQQNGRQELAFGY